MTWMLRAVASGRMSTAARLGDTPQRGARRVHVSGRGGQPRPTRARPGSAGDPASPWPGPSEADVVVHLGVRRPRRQGPPPRERDDRRRRGAHRGVARGRPATSCSCPRRMVYGAYANNPIPLTEDAILRPDVDFVYARQLAAVEALADQWRPARPGRTVTVLRPAVTMAADGTSALAGAIAAGLGQRFGEEDPAAQFLHLDDLADGRRAGRRRAGSTASTTSPRRLDRRRAGARAHRRPAADQAARPHQQDRQRAALAVPAGPDPARAVAATRGRRGWSPTTSSRPRAGARRSPTSRRTSRAPRRGGGR